MAFISILFRFIFFLFCPFQVSPNYINRYAVISQLGHLALRQPDGLILHADFESHGFIRLTDDDLVLLHDAHYIRIGVRNASAETQQNFRK